jgi:hypothetical protein
MTSAVHDDDRYLDKLGSATPSADPEDRLSLCLLAMRVVAEAKPMPELVDAETAVAVIAYEVRKRHISRTIAAACLVFLTLLVLGLALTPVTSVWWMLSAVGMSGLGGAYCAVARMRDEQWSTAELDAGQGGANS